MQCNFFLIVCYSALEKSTVAQFTSQNPYSGSNLKYSEMQLAILASSLLKAISEYSYITVSLLMFHRQSIDILIWQLAVSL